MDGGVRGKTGLNAFMCDYPGGSRYKTYHNGTSLYDVVYSKFMMYFVSFDVLMFIVVYCVC